MASSKPAILVISSHVVRGTVGNRAAAFALEVLGFPVWCIPTITLPWHPGHGPATRSVPDQAAFDAILDDLARSPWLNEIGAVLTGYLGAPGQVNSVARLVHAVKERNPTALYALDPVIGDGDSLYVAEEQAAGIRDQLLPLADLVTPNCFELGWLAGSPTPTAQHECCKLSASLGAARVLTTSAPALMQGYTGNLLTEFGNNKGRAQMAEHPSLNGPPNGLGDLTAALMTGHLLDGRSGSDALTKTTASVFEVMAHAAQTKSDELALEQNVDSLRTPRTAIQTRSLIM